VHKIALESIGRDRSDKDISDWANVTWGKLASPKATCPIRRKSKTDYWESRLAQLDGKIVLPVADLKTIPTRRKLTENDESSSNSRSCIRRRTDSQPLSVKTNVTETLVPIQIFTPPRSPELPPPTWDVISDSALVWFAQPASKIFPQLCLPMVSWKKRIARERRLHSLDSLLLGCTSGVQEGIIVIDECNAAAAEKWTRHIRKQVDSSVSLVQPIVVYGCRSGVLFRLE
jgi:DNA ligase-4